MTLSSHPSAIQFYSLAQDKHIAELEVSRSNRVARRSGSTIEPVRVERLSFTPSAEWLVTFDTWHSSGFRLESTLKFWHQKSEKEPVDYLLFSSITNPHAEHNLVAVAFAPALSYSSQSSNRLLTVDVTGCLKLWSFLPGSRTSTDKQQPAWIPTWEYNQQRDLVAHCAAWSPDGSLFAIGHSDAIAVWHAESLTCLHKFPLSASSGLPQSLSFSDDTLVAGCDGMSMGWSLLDFKGSVRHCVQPCDHEAECTL